MFVALLYVFLSTFGALTHTHGMVDVDSSEGIVIAGSAASSGNTRAIVKHVVSDPCHCPFCIWQANSVSAALPAQHLASPARFVVLVFVPKAVTPVTDYVLRASSRAPPAA